MSDERSREEPGMSPYCPGYPAPYEALVSDFPDSSTYPPADFRVEWGPLFHRGRLDGSAILLVLGQDPAAEEAISRRILVGEAGQRTQGLLGKVGIASSYVMINTYLYSVYGQGAANRHRDDHAIAEYRNRWLDVLTSHNEIAVVVSLGTLADHAFRQWQTTPAGQTWSGLHAAVLHPTYPESASSSGQITLAAATTRLLADWNAARPDIVAALPRHDVPPSDIPYGAAFTADDLAAIPAADLPVGLPAWMRSGRVWAQRTGATAAQKRATITVTASL